jgi:hypothetical protein
MGEQGRQRARTHYDWAGLVPRYMDLFSELARLRPSTAVAPGPHGLGARHPRRSDPYHSFSHYPSAHLSPDLRLRPGPLLRANTAEREAQLAAMLERPVYQNIKNSLDLPMLQAMLNRVAAQDTPVPLQDHSSGGNTEHLQRQVGWLIKSGLVQAVPSTQSVDTP